MTLRKTMKVYLIVAICIAIASPLALAAGIKERMIQRLPAIAELKTRGIIGEDNRGYLGWVSSAREQQDVIAAENKDRKTVYTHFAQQQGTTLDVVEKVQAGRKAEKAKPGEYFQNADGTWQKK